MVLNHRKKNSRHRGSWTHGWGEKKKHRGAGSRGGRGNAGSGKRGDAKKPSYWKIKNFVGKHGFTNPTTKMVTTITLSVLASNIEQFVVAGHAIKSGSTYKINLADIGVDKLLGTGTSAYTFEIVTQYATAGAIKKVEEKGGSVSVLALAKTPKQAEEKPKKAKKKNADDDEE
jgi:large subunit ribosomal protein L15